MQVCRLGARFHSPFAFHSRSLFSLPDRYLYGLSAQVVPSRSLRIKGCCRRCKKGVPTTSFRRLLGRVIGVRSLVACSRAPRGGKQRSQRDCSFASKHSALVRFALAPSAWHLLTSSPTLDLRKRILLFRLGPSSPGRTHPPLEVGKANSLFDLSRRPGTLRSLCGARTACSTSQ